MSFYHFQGPAEGDALGISPWYQRVMDLIVRGNRGRGATNTPSLRGTGADFSS